MQYFSNNQFHWKYSVRLNQNDSIAIEQYSVSWYKSVRSIFSITSIVTFIYSSISRTRLSIETFYEYLTMSKYLREFYSAVRMTVFTSIYASFALAFIFISAITFKSTFAQQSVEHVFSSFIFAITFEFVATFISFSTFDFLSFSSVLCDHVSEDHFMTQNLKTLYSMHLIENAKILRCNWYVQIKKTQENYHLRKHELQMKNKIKQKTKKLLKQQKKVRLIKKRIEKYTCRRCKHSIKFDNNIKFHEHIRIRHAKKSKSVSSQSIVSSFTSSRSITFSFFVSSSQSIFSSSSTSSKLIVESLTTFFFEISSDFSSIATSKKSIFWTEIVSRFVASKFSRFSIATFKSMCKSLKNANIVCSSISSRIFSSTSSRFYFIVNDLIRMFVEKSSSFDLQSSQNKSLFSRNFDNCSFKSKCDFIQSRITLYFHAMITSVFKTIKFEIFESTHVRENLSRKFSIFSSISFIWSRLFRSTSRFSMIFRLSSVCRHCQERFVIYWFTDWVMSVVTRIENNEIFMKIRFASFRSALKKYWFLFEKVTTLKKLEHVVCLLFCSFFFFLLIVDRSWSEKA